MLVRGQMVWLFVLSLFIIFIVPSRFRLQVLGSLILLVLAGFLLSQPGERTEEDRGLIPIGQVEFADVGLQRSRGVGREFMGKLLNHSPSYTLTGLGIQLIIKDCMGGDDASEEDCAVLEDVKVHISLFAPPGDEREFNKRLYFRELHPQGYVRWEYIILYTEAKKGESWRNILLFQD
jgi:hypothetical protein